MLGEAFSLWRRNGHDLLGPSSSTPILLSIAPAVSIPRSWSAANTVPYNVRLGWITSVFWMLIALSSAPSSAEQSSGFSNLRRERQGRDPQPLPWQSTLNRCPESMRTDRYQNRSSSVQNPEGSFGSFLPLSPSSLFDYKPLLCNGWDRVTIISCVGQSKPAFSGLLIRCAHRNWA
jgi:hypothetical protein